MSSARSETLDALSTKFEGLLERMQTPAARKGMEEAFNFSPAALAQAAAKAAALQHSQKNPSDARAKRLAAPESIRK